MPLRLSRPALALALGALASPALAIVGGAASRDPDGPRRSVTLVESAAGHLCSGALVAPDIVLTAAHCMAGTAYSVTVLDRAFRPRTVPVATTLVHPSFRPGLRPDTQPGIDLALLRLDHALGADYVPLDPARARAAAAGDVLTLAGFGQGDERRGSARVLRQARLVVSGTASSANRVVVAVDSGRRADGAGACIGDSGGPALAGRGAGLSLVGIVTWAKGPAGGRRPCGGPTALTPVAENAGWVREGVARLRRNPALSASR